MTLQNRLDNLYPSADEIPEQFRAGPAIEQRDYLVNGELHQWQGPLAPVLSPVSLKTAAGLESVVLGSTPLMDADTAMTALDGCLADHARGRANSPRRDLPQIDARAARCSSDAADVGDRQESQGFAERVRPHLRLHRRHHQRAQGTGSTLQPFRARAGHPRSDPSRATGRDPVHGPLQLPAQRNLHHADSGADHGQHRACC
jgi:hypothetical protein